MNKKDVLAAATVANLFLARSWNELLNQSDDFLRKALPTRGMLVATLCLALLTGLILAARSIISRNPTVEKWLWWTPWLLLLAPLNRWRQQFQPLFGSWPPNIVFAAILLVAVAATVLGKRVRVETAIRTFALLISPLLVLTFAQAFLLPLVTSRRPTTPATMPSEGRTPMRSRVVLIVFDELDRVRAFSERPANLQLEHFDALQKQSIYGENAISPEEETTRSIPSYLLNRRISKVDPLAFGKITGIDEATGKPVDIAKSPNLFSKVFAAGGRSAVVGWFLPYCRIFAGSTYCHWEMSAGKAIEEYQPVATLMLQNFAKATGDLPFAKRLSLTAFGDARINRVDQNAHRSSYEAILERATSIVANPDFDLVYLHIPVPHFPVIIDRTGKWIDYDSDDYYANLVLADRALGELQSVLESSRMWEKTNVIVVGDHGFRVGPTPRKGSSAWRHVPFLLKLAGQHERVDYSPRFDTLIIHDLALMLLQHKSMPPAETVDWLEQHKID